MIHFYIFIFFRAWEKNMWFGFYFIQREVIHGVFNILPWIKKSRINVKPGYQQTEPEFDAFFGDRATDLPLQSASEDFSDLPDALSAPYSYWGIGGTDPATYRRAADAGRTAQDVPVNHAPTFAPVLQPTLDTGTQALVVAALAWLGRPANTRTAR